MRTLTVITVKNKSKSNKKPLYLSVRRLLLAHNTFMRTIIHSDLNNFYASVECLRNPEIRDKPVVVVGSKEDRHGIVLAKNMFSWYLNFLPRKEEGVNNYIEICTIKIEFEEARQYRKLRKGMLRRCQWRDVTAHIYV